MAAVSVRRGSMTIQRVSGRRACFFQTAQQHRMGVGQIAAGKQHAVGLFQIGITGGRAIGPESLFIGSDGAGHAQAGIGVDIVGSHHALGQLVEQIVVLGQQLAGHVKSHRVRPVLADDAGKTFRHAVQRAVPVNALARRIAGGPHFRVQCAATVAGGAGRQVQPLAAQPAKIGRMLRVAAHTGNASIFAGNQHATACAAIAAGGAGFSFAHFAHPFLMTRSRCNPPCS
jgi:hypothetical protein